MPKPFDIDRLFEGSLQRLQAEAEYFSRLTDHNPELGRLNESHLVALLRSYLPPKYGIGTGFIACGGDNPQQSPQCDIILYDALNNAPLYKSDTWSIYPIEMVYGVIEVKTKLDKRQLKNAFEKCTKIRAMAITSEGKPNKFYMRQKPLKQPGSAVYGIYPEDLPPRFMVFAYDGWKTIKGLEDNFKKLSKQYRLAHIHGVCNLYSEGSLYVSHQAYQSGDAHFLSIEDNGFHRFLSRIPISLDSMLRIDRRGLGFDLVYLDRYERKVE